MKKVGIIIIIASLVIFLLVGLNYTDGKFNKDKIFKEEIIKEVISLCCEEADILPLAEKRLNIILKGKEKPDYKDLNKLKEYLIRQGYGYEKVSEALELIREKYED